MTAYNLNALNNVIRPYLDNYYFTCNDPNYIKVGDIMFHEEKFQEVIAITPSSRGFMIAFKDNNKISEISSSQQIILSKRPSKPSI